MPQEIEVGKADDFAEFGRKLVLSGDTKIGVFRVNGGFVAYENTCLHQGGPVCEGKVVGRVEPVLEEDANVVAEQLSDDVKHVVCPWHGYEYELATGKNAADPALQLRRYETRERNGVVYVLV